jgi:hypothetical protein
MAKKALMLGVVACLTVAATLAVGSPAMAHATSAYLDNQTLGRLGHGGVHTGHTYAYACDDKADGLGIDIIYELRNGLQGQIKDTNGSSPGCSGGVVAPPQNPIVKYLIHASNGYTTAWIAA